MEPTDQPTQQEEAADPSFEVNAEVLQQLMSGGNAELVGALQKALGKMVGTSSGYLESLPKPVQNRIEYLREVDEKRHALEEEFEAKVKALETEYTALYAPLDQELRQVVKGDKDVPANEGQTADAPAGIPDFWLVALRNMPALDELITDRDAEVLAYLENMDEEEVEDDDESFRIVFHFKENPFFSNKTLSKTYYMGDDEDAVVRRIEADTIDWKSPAKNVTVKVMKKKGKGKGSSAQTKLVETESFFNWFSVPEIPEEGEEIDDEELEGLQAIVEADFDIAVAIREHILEHPVPWFTGEALYEDDSEEEEDDEDDEDDDDEDDEDDDEDSEEDSDDDDEAPAARQSKKPVAKDAKAQPQECNQQ